MPNSVAQHWTEQLTRLRVVELSDVPDGIEFANAILPSASYVWIKIGPSECAGMVNVRVAQSGDVLMFGEKYSVAVLEADWNRNLGRKYH